MTKDGCGPSSPVSLASLGPDGCWRKMYQGYLALTLDGSLEEFSETWPRSGMMRSGIVYQLQPLAPLTAEIGYSFLPTIGANEYMGSSRGRYVGSPLFRGAKMSEGLRTCEKDPIYTHPCFAELAMGFPIGWTDLERSETP